MKLRMEIERKFLVKDINAINEIISKYPRKTITQDYLYVDDYTAVRKRKIEKVAILNMYIQ